MASKSSYIHEANRRESQRPIPLIRIFKDKHRLLDEYVKSHDILTREDIQRMSFRQPETGLRNYTKKTGQTFIHIDYDTWHKSEMVAPTPVVRSGRPRMKKDKNAVYKCKYCKKKISPTSKKGLCRRCGRPPIYNKKKLSQH